MFFSLCFTRWKIKKWTSKDEIREKQKKEQKKLKRRKTNSAWLCLILPRSAGSVNCTSADRVTSNIYRGHFGFFKQGNAVFIKSSLFWQVSIENIAMHSFFKIMLWSEITNFLTFWNPLKIRPFRNKANPGSLCNFSVLDTWPKAWPDDVITSLYWSWKS